MPFETFFRWVEGQGHRGQIKVKMVKYMYGACPSHNLYILHSCCPRGGDVPFETFFQVG